MVDQPAVTRCLFAIPLAEPSAAPAYRAAQYQAPARQSGPRASTPRRHAHCHSLLHHPPTRWAADAGLEPQAPGTAACGWRVSCGHAAASAAPASLADCAPLTAAAPQNPVATVRMTLTMRQIMQSTCVHAEVLIRWRAIPLFGASARQNTVHRCRCRAAARLSRLSTPPASAATARASDWLAAGWLDCRSAAARLLPD